MRADSRACRRRRLPGVRELLLLGATEDDPLRTVCELVSHIRRIRPQVVLTTDTNEDAGSAEHARIAELATTAILLAADVHAP